MISEYGGPHKFYSKYFIHAVCPLGFTKNGLNFNYYDSKELEESVTPFIISSLKKLISFPVSGDLCYCLGSGKNLKYLLKLNEKHHFFRQVIGLPHPRWIVQYRRKSYKEFIQDYLEHLYVREFGNLNQTIRF
jgi:hypothetical protein